MRVLELVGGTLKFVEIGDEGVLAVPEISRGEIFVFNFHGPTWFESLIVKRVVENSNNNEVAPFPRREIDN